MNKDENGCTRVKGTSQSLACHLQAMGSRYSLREDSLSLSAPQICTLTPSMLDIVLSQMHKFSGKPASSLRLLLGKSALIPSVPDFPGSFWLFYLIRLIQGWTCQTHSRLDLSEGTMPTGCLPSGPHRKGKLFSLAMACCIFLSCFLSELTFCLDSFWASSSGKILKNWSGQKMTGCLSSGMLSWTLACTLVLGYSATLSMGENWVILVPRIIN